MVVEILICSGFIYYNLSFLIFKYIFKIFVLVWFIFKSYILFVVILIECIENLDKWKYYVNELDMFNNGIWLI